MCPLPVFASIHPHRQPDWQRRFNFPVFFNQPPQPGLARSLVRSAVQSQSMEKQAVADPVCSFCWFSVRERIFNLDCDIILSSLHLFLRRLLRVETETATGSYGLSWAKSFVLGWIQVAALTSKALGRSHACGLSSVSFPAYDFFLAVWLEQHKSVYLSMSEFFFFSCNRRRLSSTKVISTELLIWLWKNA